MMKTMRRTMGGMAALAAAVLATACLDDRAAGPLPDASMPVRLGLQANILGAAAGQKVRIRTFYRRVDGTNVTLESTPNEVAVTPGASQTVSVEVRVGPCLADAQRETETTGACQIGVELTLLDEAGGVIDQQAAPPSSPATPGTSVTIREPITLADVSTITVTPIPSLRMGDTRTLTATARDASGGQLARTFTWASDNPTVLTVNATTGAATAVGPGTARVTASSGTKSGSGSARVLRRVTTVSLNPSPAPSLKAAATLSFSVLAKDASGADAGDMSERTIVWTATNPAGATRTASVAPNGTVTGVFPGDADITVSVDGVTGTSRVRVTAGDIRVTPTAVQLVVGGTQAVQAAVVDANGFALSGIPVSWSSANTSVATVAANGTVTAAASGQTTLTVSGGGVSNTVPVTVGTLALAVTPNGVGVLAGNTLQLSVAGALGPVTWQTSSATIATVSATGLVTARFPGSVTMTATVVTPAGTQRGTATLGVTAASLQITPTSATIFVGQSVQFSATAYDTRGAVLSGLPVFWRSSDPQYVPVNSSGLVIGYVETEGGPATIEAAAGGLNATALVHVLYSGSFMITPRAEVRPAPPRTTIRTPSGN